MNNFLITAFVLLLAISSCKNTKNAQTDAMSDHEQKEALRREALEANPLQVMTEEDVASDEEMAQAELAEKKFPDSLVARIQRTACFGTCPVYTISVYNTGFATYEGQNFVDNKGYYGAYISRNVINTLQNMAKEIGFMELESRYDTPGMTDVPSTITTIRIDEQLKSVVNRDGGPEKLEDFEKFFDSLFEKVDWDDDFKNPHAQ